MNWALSISFTDFNFPLVELELWNRNICMSFTGSLSNASSLKKQNKKQQTTNDQRRTKEKTHSKRKQKKRKKHKTQTAERNNRKFPGRRSRHPLRNEVEIFLRTHANVEPVVILCHKMYTCRFQVLYFIFTFNCINYMLPWWVHYYYVWQEHSSLQAFIYQYYFTEFLVPLSLVNLTVWSTWTRFETERIQDYSLCWHRKISGTHS